MDYTKYRQLEFRRRFWVPFGAKITVQDPSTETIVGFIKMKAWKLREDVRLYTDESMQTEVFRIHARNIIDLGATYDVIDSPTEQALFSFKRKGLRSIFVRDHWNILDTQGNEVGYVQETSGGLALFRRWIGIIPYIGDIIDLALAFAPQTYQVVLNNAPVAVITHRKNPFIVKMALDTTMAATPADARLTVSVTALLSIIEASKNN